MKLLSTGNPKVLKGIKQGYNTYILHLAPADLSGKEVCPKRTVGCSNACLNLAGRGGMFKKGETTNTIQQARIRKTKMFFEDRNAFMSLLVKDILLALKQSERLGLIPVFRLNGTSDLSWEKYGVQVGNIHYVNIFEAFPHVQFYDYTKVLGRKVVGINNYDLTFSAADGNDLDVLMAKQQGYNIAVVFDLKKTQEMPETYYNRPVFNGDDSDLRFLDPKGVVVGLYAKGKAKKDTTGFVKSPYFSSLTVEKLSQLRQIRVAA
jgi:hypothetical protein